MNNNNNNNNKKSFYCWYLGYVEQTRASLSDTDRLGDLVNDLIKNHDKEKASTISTTNTTATNTTTTTTTTATRRHSNRHSCQIKPATKVTLSLNKTCIHIIDVEIRVKKKLFKKSSQKIVNKTYAVQYEHLLNVLNLKRSWTAANHNDVVTLVTKHQLTLVDGDKSTSKPDKSAKRNSHVPDLDRCFVHVFRFDSDESAAKMEYYLAQFRSKYFSSFLDHNTALFVNRFPLVLHDDADDNHDDDPYDDEVILATPSTVPYEINQHLLNNNLRKREEYYYQTSPQPSSDSNANNNYSSASNSSSSYEAIEHINVQRSPLRDNLNREILEKFNSGQPILFPPKDYTNVDRARGDLNEAAYRRSQNPFIVGRAALRSINDRDQSPSTSSASGDLSLDEQTNEALKLLDDVVNSAELGDEQRPQVYEFKPPKTEPHFYMSSSDVNNNDDHYPQVRSNYVGAQRLSTYQPQWLPNGPTVQSTKTTSNSANHSGNENVRLVASANGGGRFVMDFLKKNIPLPAVQPDYASTQNSEFILRPAARSANSLDYSFVPPYANKNLLQKRSLNASKSNISLKAGSDMYNFNDVYY